MLFKNINCEEGQLFSYKIKPRSQHDDTLSTLAFPHGKTSRGPIQFRVGFVQTSYFSPEGAGKDWEKAGRFMDSLPSHTSQ